MASGGPNDLDPGGDATSPTSHPAAIAPSGRTLHLDWAKKLEGPDNHGITTSIAAQFSQ